jgi:hypothetical protein
MSALNLQTIYFSSKTITKKQIFTLCHGITKIPKTLLNQKQILFCFGWLNVNQEPKKVYVSVGKTQNKGFMDASSHNAGSIICFRSIKGNAKIFFFELWFFIFHLIFIKIYQYYSVRALFTISNFTSY